MIFPIHLAIALAGVADPAVSEPVSVVIQREGDIGKDSSGPLLVPFASVDADAHYAVFQRAVTTLLAGDKQAARQLLDDMIARSVGTAEGRQKLGGLSREDRERFAASLSATASSDDGKLFAEREYYQSLGLAIFLREEIDCGCQPPDSVDLPAHGYTFARLAAFRGNRDRVIYWLKVSGIEHVSPASKVVTADLVAEVGTIRSYSSAERQGLLDPYLPTLIAAFEQTSPGAEALSRLRSEWADFLIARGRYAEAETLLDRIEPASGTISNRRLALLFSTGRASKATGQLRQSLARNDPDAVKAGAEFQARLMQVRLVPGINTDGKVAILEELLKGYANLKLKRVGYAREIVELLLEAGRPEEAEARAITLIAEASTFDATPFEIEWLETARIQAVEMQNRWDEATVRWRQLLGLQDGAPMTLQLAGNHRLREYAGHLERKGSFDEALHIVQAAKAVLRAQKDPLYRRPLAAIMLSLSGVLLQIGKADAALVELRGAARLREAEPRAPDDPGGPKPDEQRLEAAILEALNQAEKATPIRRAIVERASNREDYNFDNAAYIAARVALARNLALSKADPEKTRADFAELLPLVRQLFGPLGSQTLSVTEPYAQLLVGMGRYHDALSLARITLQGRIAQADTRQSSSGERQTRMLAHGRARAARQLISIVWAANAQ